MLYLFVIWVDDPHRNPNSNDRDHLVGQLTRLSLICLYCHHHLHHQHSHHHLKHVDVRAPLEENNGKHKREPVNNAQKQHCLEFDFSLNRYLKCKKEIVYHEHMQPCLKKCTPFVQPRRGKDKDKTK